MSMKGKYVILDGYLCELPFIFHNSISHDNFAQALSHLGKPVSAGFVDVVDGEVSAHGKSYSLKLGSRPQDSDIIHRLFE